MKTFTGWEYLLIDAANNCHLDLDKLQFEQRIDWANKNLDNLEQFYSGEWKNKPLYIKAVMAIREAQQGYITGHLMGFDAVCSGIQIMSALTGCFSGALATGLVDPDVRSDAYAQITKEMEKTLGYAVPVNRKDVKNAAVPHFYGSKKEPKNVFGDDTVELDAFLKATYAVAPGASELLQDLVNSWQPYALSHSWKLPDGYTAFVKVMEKVEQRIEVDEIDHCTFTYVYYQNAGEKRGVKNAANVIHSIDAYIQRCLIRRCNYDRERAMYISEISMVERLARQILSGALPASGCTDQVLNYYLEQYNRTGIADIVILPHIDDTNIRYLSTKHLAELDSILQTMLEHQPFEIITVHDDFRAHPNNINHLRMHYRNILAELADSELLADLLSQIHGIAGCTYEKHTPDLGKYIRQSNYALC